MARGATSARTDGYLGALQSVAPDQIAAVTNTFVAIADAIRTGTVTQEV